MTLWLPCPSQEGPQISWRDLTSFQNCTAGQRAYSCEIFESRRPSTIAMTVLVRAVLNVRPFHPVYNPASPLRQPTGSTLMPSGPALSVKYMAFRCCHTADDAHRTSADLSTGRLFLEVV